MTRPKMQIRSPFDLAVLQECVDSYFPDRLPYADFRRVVDVGAHIGGWTSVVKLRAPECEVWAFECWPDNFRLLQNNVGQLPGVHLYSKRVAYAWQTATLHQSPGNTGANGWVFDPNAPFDENTMMLEDELPSVAFDCLKIDVEGAEFDILHNITPRLLRAFKHIVGECHANSGDPYYLMDRLLHWFTLRAWVPQGRPEEGLSLFWFERRVTE